MKLQMAVSKLMEDRDKLPNSTERCLMRIPEKLRNECGLRVGEYIDVATIDGNVITLQVAGAFKNDLFLNDSVGYVTSTIFELMNKSKEIVVEEVKQVKGITYGCDPEMFLIDKSGTVISASYFFSKQGEIGHDGVLLELRPRPSIDPSEVTSYLHNLVNKTIVKLAKQEIRLWASSAVGKIFAGFHVHMGIPQKILAMPNNALKKLLAMKMVSVLDYYVGIPSVIPEGEEESARRTEAYIDYGKPGNFRTDLTTLEYRVPGGTMMKHPILADGLLNLCCVVMEDMVSRLKEYTDDFEYDRVNDVSSGKILAAMYPELPPMEEVFRCIVCNKVDNAYGRLDNIIRDAQKMVGYKDRSSKLDLFFNALSTRTKFSNLMNDNWRA